MKKYTSKGLPVVTEGLLDSLFDRYTNKISNRRGALTYGDVLSDSRQRITKENPVLRKFMESQVGKYSPDMHNAMFEVLVGMYAILELQSEINLHDKEERPRKPS